MASADRTDAAPITVDLAKEAPGKTVVLTFDDAVKSHLTVVAPILLEHGFRASFFITHRWMDDRENFLTWDEVRELHNLGFEIGNHAWTHPNFGVPKVAARMAGELSLVEQAMRAVEVPRPISFAWCGNGLGPEGVRVLSSKGYRFARRGMQPEIPYGEIVPGPLYDPKVHHPLLIPTAGDAYPDWDLAHFKKVVDRAGGGRIAVVQFHGVPDVAHPWVHTPPERFREYMAYLKNERFHVLALEDLAEFLPPVVPDDPLAGTRFPERDESELELPVETVATRGRLSFWRANMLERHGYSVDEAAQVCGWTVPEFERQMQAQDLAGPATLADRRVLPYPGGRQPRIGFHDGAVDPLRGTKASLFTPWDDGGYAVLDLPEAIFSGDGLLFLAHTHVPTVWNEQNIVIDNVDWLLGAGGEMTLEWLLPNGVRFGAVVTPSAGGADCELWLENGSGAPLDGLRTQVCLMLKAAHGFNTQTNTNKQLEAPVAAVHSTDGERWILVAFDRCGRTWANPEVPCLHADPVLPAVAPGGRATVRGRVRFHEGPGLAEAIARVGEGFSALIA